MYTLEQQKANRALWIKELRETDKKQGQEFLKQKNNKGEYLYCCLGIGCEVAIANGVPVAIEREGNIYKYDKEEVELPEVVRDWLGLKESLGETRDEKGMQVSLASLNDHRLYSFKQIADYLESDPPGVFVGPPE